MTKATFDKKETLFTNKQLLTFKKDTSEALQIDRWGAETYDTSTSRSEIPGYF